MNTEDLEKLLAQQPASRLHRLARGRVPRQFRYGKHRLVEALLRTPADKRDALIADLNFLIDEHEKLANAHRSIQHPERRPPAPGGADLHVRQPDSDRADSGSHEPPPDLTAFLEGIGVPPPQPFQPDSWQLDALAHLESTDVIVSVPTGSGKTYVAVEATRRAIQEDRSVIYTSPLKALSNTKFTEFVRLFGPDRVGILTGDRRDNPQAPLLIMTTEILRNLLYDAAGGEIDVRLDTLGLVIMDEFQYLADPERGVVWEETIIFCPTQARLLLLSASIGNPQDIAAWLTSIRPTPCHLVRHHRRSVPLRAGYLHPNGKLSPLFRTIGIPQRGGTGLHPEALRLFGAYEDETLRGR